MKILHIKLVNFIGVKAAMGLQEIELDFSRNDKPIIQLYGKNRCGKTVMIQQLHPYSTINLSGDERSDLPLILPNAIGIKNIVYEVDNNVYNITHTYKPQKNGTHTVSSSILCNGEEINPSGGVTTFNSIIERILGINKYSIQFIINGTQLTSIANMTPTQRKTLLNKAMGIDIYDKIHQLSTEDYRYTSKRITSINSAIEHMLSNYGSYDNFKKEFDDITAQRDKALANNESLKKEILSLQSVVDTLESQNVRYELHVAEDQYNEYQSIVSQYGAYDESTYDSLINEQIQLNAQITECKSNRMILMHDLDTLYDKRNTIQSNQNIIKQNLQDKERLESIIDELSSKIKAIDDDIPYAVNSSSDKLLSMMSLGQVINSTCTEIVTSINGKHLSLFCEMINKNIDISQFLANESSALSDSEKERNAISRLRSILNNVAGDDFDDCCHKDDCIYKLSYDMMQSYFRSYQSVSPDQFTLYDIDQMNHAYQNIQTIRRLLSNTTIPEELSEEFTLQSIMMNISNNNQHGIDINHLKELISVASQIETRVHLNAQLEEAKRSLSIINKQSSSNNSFESYLTQLDQISETISTIQNQLKTITDTEEEISQQLSINNRKKTLLSQIKNINPSALHDHLNKTRALYDKLITTQSTLDMLKEDLSISSQTLSQLSVVYNNLQTTNESYIQNINELSIQTIQDKRYKIISEATSSTKGKPVIAIRDTITNALSTANTLLDVMYNGEIRLSNPIINETEFSLPFRCNANVSPDIKFGSQSESTLLSLALSLSLASYLTTYNIPLIDEIDAYIDSHMRENFLLMLQEIMTTLRMEQMFLISHSISPSQYEPIIHPVNLSDIIDDNGGA